MNIIYFVNYFPPNTGATAINSFKITEYLVKYGHEIKILAPGEMSKTFQMERKFQGVNFNTFEVIRSNSLIKFPFNLIFSHMKKRFYLKH